MDKRPGFMVCVCPDAYLLRKHIQHMLKTHAPDGAVNPLGAPSTPATWERHVFWGDDELNRTFWENLALQGLFSAPKALILRNAHVIKADEWKKLSKAFAKPIPHAWPFICLEVAFEKGRPKVPAHISKLPFYSFAERQGWLWTSSGINEHQIAQYIARRARELKLTLAPDHLEQLAATLPADATAIENELAKWSLLASAPKGSGTTQPLASFTQQEMNIFQFISMLQAGKANAVWQQVMQEQNKGQDAIFPLLALLQREARLMWQILVGEPGYMRPQDAASKKQLALRLGMAGLARLWDSLHTAELSIKSGHATPPQAYNVLVADILLLVQR